MRILYHADKVAEGIGHRSDLDPFADIVRLLDHRSTDGLEMLHRFIDARDSPPRD